MTGLRWSVVLAMALAACGDSPVAPGTKKPEQTPPDATVPAAEGRALWVNRFEYDSPAKIAAIFAKAADANFNIVYFQVRGASDALYRSSIEPCAVSLCGRLGGTPSWDPLEVAVREAHARGLQLHAWLNALPGWGSGTEATCRALVESETGNPRHALLEHPEWRVADATGAAHACPNKEEYVYLSPGVPEVRTRLARVAADITRRYAVDGIHLDRIRLPGPAWTYDAASLKAFGKEPAAFPEEWGDFRRELVSLVVREVHDSINAVRRPVVLSAATWGIYADRWGWRSSQGAAQYFQDPEAWARRGFLDVAAPMTYYTIKPTYCEFADWSCLLDDHVQRIQTGGGRHVYVGIAARYGATEAVRQIELSRKQGARGVSVYSYGSAESAGLWSVLRAGPFARKAAVPAMPWK